MSGTLPQIPNMGAIGLRGASRRMREISLFVTFFFSFLFFVFSPRLQVATVDRFSPSIRQTTRFHARKCLLGVSVMNFHIYPLLFPKIWKFALRPMATSNGNNPAIFKDRRKMFAPNLGVFGVWQLRNLLTDFQKECDNKVSQKTNCVRRSMFITPRSGRHVHRVPKNQAPKLWQ